MKRKVFEYELIGRAVNVIVPYQLPEWRDKRFIQFGFQAPAPDRLQYPTYSGVFYFDLATIGAAEAAALVARSAVTGEHLHLTFW